MERTLMGLQNDFLNCLLYSLYLRVWNRLRSFQSTCLKTLRWLQRIWQLWQFHFDLFPATSEYIGIWNGWIKESTSEWVDESGDDGPAAGKLLLLLLRATVKEGEGCSKIARYVHPTRRTNQNAFSVDKRILLFTLPDWSCFSLLFSLIWNIAK